VSGVLVTEKFKRFLIVSVAAILVAGLGAVAFLWFKEPASRSPGSIAVEVFPERLERGKYLAHHVALCIHCHSDKQGDKIGYPPVLTAIGDGGSSCWDEATGHGSGFRVCPSNITSDAEFGLGGWSDGEIMRAIREGVDRDGKALFPLMPYSAYRSLSDEDAKALLVYLRSLAPIRKEVPARELPLLLGIEVKFQPKPLVAEVPDPPANDPVARGKYLTTIAGCNQCHTPVDDNGKPISAREFSGGQAFSLGGGSRVFASNLTPAKSGLGDRTEAEFVGIFQGFATDVAAKTSVPAGLNTVMPWLSYAFMKTDDLKAIYAYLRTLPPVENVVSGRRMLPPSEVRRAAQPPTSDAASDAVDSGKD
jgi:hypothetical protein